VYNKNKAGNIKLLQKGSIGCWSEQQFIWFLGIQDVGNGLWRLHLYCESL